MILITGASKGIGLYLQEKFLNDGEEVLGTYNSSIPASDKLENFIKINVTDFATIQEKILTRIQDKKKLILLNCAGISYNSFAHKSNPSEWQKVINVNLIGTFNMINFLLPFMRSNNFGRIINFSSVVPILGVEGTSAYSASKSALWGMSRAICKENATKGITINNLNLGYFDIGMLKEIPIEILNQIEKSIPCKKFGNPEEIFKIIKTLIDCSYINGSSININGGLI